MQRRSTLIGPTLDRRQVDDNQVLNTRSLTIAADVIANTVDGLAMRPGDHLIRAVHILAEIDAADGRPGLHATHRRRYELRLLAVKHPVLPHRIFEVLAMQIPSREVQIAVGSDP